MSPDSIDLRSRKFKKMPCASSRVAVASIVLSIVCLVVIVGGGCWLVFFGVDVLLTSTSIDGDNDNEEVCIPCSDVFDNANDDTKSLSSEDFSEWHRMTSLTMKEDENTQEQLCCISSGARNAVLLKSVLNNHEGFSKLTSIVGTRQKQSVRSHNSAVSAHLLYKPPTERNYQPDKALLQHWMDPSESSFSHMSEGLRFHDNTIYVMTPGVYFVYCQILYNTNSSATAGQPASHYVYRNSILHPPTSGIVMKSRHTPYDQQRHSVDRQQRHSNDNLDTDRHSSYVGGLLLMHPSDQLYVKVSDSSIVAIDNGGSFFGLFKIGD